MAVLRTPPVAVEPILQKIRGKYFTLAELGVPARDRIAVGIELAKRGHNKKLVKLEGRTLWVWLAQPHAVDFDNAEARLQLVPVTPGKF